MLDLTVAFEDESAIIGVSGYVDHHTVEEARRVAFAALATGAKAVTLDLTAMTFIDSSGIRLLWELIQRTGERGGGLTVRNPSSVTCSMLEICGLSEAIETERTAVPTR